MHFLKLVMNQGLDTTSMLEAEDNSPTLGSVNKGATVVGEVRGWSGASSSVVKHQQSYRPSTRSSSSPRFADNNKLLSVFTVIGLILIFSNFTKMYVRKKSWSCDKNHTQNFYAQNTQSMHLQFTMSIKHMTCMPYTQMGFLR